MKVAQYFFWGLIAAGASVSAIFLVAVAAAWFSTLRNRVLNGAEEVAEIERRIAEL